MNRISTGAALAAAVLVAATLGFAPHSHAQTNPSVDQLIDQLKPKASAAHGPIRGLRKQDDAVAPTSDIPAPAPAAPRSVAHASATPTPAPTSAPPSAPPASTSAPSTELASANIWVEFASGSAKLTPEAMATLDRLGKALTSDTLAGYKFRIEGHTDTVGSKQHNLSLSEERAAAVASYIEQKFGVTGTRLVPVGVGSDHLLVPTPDQTPEARNRRVQVVNLGA